MCFVFCIVIICTSLVPFDAFGALAYFDVLGLVIAVAHTIAKRQLISFPYEPRLLLALCLILIYLYSFIVLSIHLFVLFILGCMSRCVLYYAEKRLVY